MAPTCTWTRPTEQLGKRNRRRGESLCVLLALLISVILLSGCHIEFTAETVISPDATITRTTRYVADRDKLEEHYGLPPGGTWEIQQVIKYDESSKKWVEEKHDVYTATLRYQGAAGASIPPDYIRRGKKPGHVSLNEIRLTVSEDGETFEYEERFRDVADFEKFEKVMRDFYQTVTDHLAETLAGELGNNQSSVEVGNILHGTLDPWLIYFLEGTRREGERFLKSFEKELGNPPSFEEWPVDRITEALPPPAHEPADSWRRVIAEGIEKAVKASQSVYKEAIEIEEEELFGVYGLVNFTKHTFKVTLSLPGKIIDSNATTEEGNTLTWELTPEDFRWRDYVLRARSRIADPVSSSGARE